VFVKNEDGEPEEREIEVGLRNDTMAEVKSGLKEGDQVVMNPGKLLQKKKGAARQNGKDKKKGPEFGPGQKIGPKKPGGPGGPPKGKPGPGSGNWQKDGKGPKGPGGNGAGAGDFDPKKMMEMKQKFDKALEKATTPQQRKQVINQFVPNPEWRKMIKEKLASEGKPVAD
jgi:hypothetical protein